MTKTVLLGWELGGGGGHLGRFIPLIELLLRQEWRVVIGLFETPTAHAMLAHFADNSANQLLIVWLPKIRYPAVSADASSLTAVLEDMGHTDVILLRRLIGAWEDIIRSYSPTIIISDFAPCLNIAGLNRVRTCVLGNGWTVPPRNLVPFNSLQENAAEMLYAASERSRTAIAAATDNRLKEVTIDTALRGDDRFVCTAVELDPYSKVRDDEIYWPLEIGWARPCSPQGQGDRSRGLLYLPRGHPATQSALTAVHESPTVFYAYLGHEIEYHFKGLTVFSQPIPLGDYLPTVSVLIHHGGLGMACWGLAFGVPQLVCPMDMEKAMIGSALTRLGFGDTFSRHDGVGAILESLERVSRLSPPGVRLSELKTTNGCETLKYVTRMIQRA